MIKTKPMDGVVCLHGSIEDEVYTLCYKDTYIERRRSCWIVELNPKKCITMVGVGLSAVKARIDWYILNKE